MLRLSAVDTSGTDSASAHSGHESELDPVAGAWADEAPEASSTSAAPSAGHSEQSAQFSRPSKSVSGQQSQEDHGFALTAEVIDLAPWTDGHAASSLVTWSGSEALPGVGVGVSLDALDWTSSSLLAQRADSPWHEPAQFFSFGDSVNFVETPFETKSSWPTSQSSGGHVDGVAVAAVEAGPAPAALSWSWSDAPMRGVNPELALLAVKAYGKPLDLGPRFLDSELQTAFQTLDSRWTPLPQSVIHSKIAGQAAGFFLNKNAAAYVASGVVDDAKTLVIAFRGTDLDDLHPDYHTKADVLDWLDVGNHYALFSDLLTDVHAYIAQEGISKVMVTGHSLGGSMAQLYLASEGRPSGVDYVGATFGSPGAPTGAGLPLVQFANTNDVVAAVGLNTPSTLDVASLRQAILDADSEFGGWDKLGAFLVAALHEPSLLSYLDDILATDVGSDSSPKNGYYQYGGQAVWLSTYAAPSLLFDPLNNPEEHDKSFYAEEVWRIAGLPGQSFFSASGGSAKDLSTAQLGYGSLSNGWDSLREQYRLIGSGSLVGGHKADIIQGRSDSDDTLWGLDGADWLDGWGGADLMYGGSGNDTYKVDQSGELVRELAGDMVSDAGGHDTVEATCDYTLPDFVETLILQRWLLYDEPFNGTGNSTANLIVGNDAANTLRGEGGNDTLQGLQDPDYLMGGAGNDSLEGGDGNDELLGQDDDDTLVGMDGDDNLFGGLGNDLYVYRSRDGDDTITDTGGFDKLVLVGISLTDLIDVELNDSSEWLKVRIDVPWWLFDDVVKVNAWSELGEQSVEQFVVDGATYTGTALQSLLEQIANGDLNTVSEGADLFVGSTNSFGFQRDDDVNGHGGDDTIYGNGGDDTLRGGEGSDWLHGGRGDDSIEGDAGDDIIIFSEDRDTIDGGSGSDFLQVFLLGSVEAFSGTLDPNVTKFLSLGGASAGTVIRVERIHAELGSGNDYVQVVSGEANFVDAGGGNDTVTLGAGRDTVIGGAGHDVISTGEGDDSVEGGAGDDVIDLGNGSGWVDGGAGVDRLSLDLSPESHALRYYFGDGSGHFGADYQATGASFDQLRSALAGIDEFLITNNSFFRVQFRNVEKVDIIAGSGNDLVIYRGGSYYDGGAGGGDAFYGDFSALTESTTWDADAGAVTTLPGVTVANFECFQLATGSGNDVVKSTLSGVSQYVDGGAGNDTVTLGAGRDTVIGGAGDDVISTGEGHDSVEGGAGDDVIDLGTGGGWVDGGAGVDRLSLDLSPASFDLRYYFGDGSGHFGSAYTAAASFDQLRSELAGVDEFFISIDYGFSWVQFRNVEKVNIVAGSGNDLVIYRGGSYYDGGAGGGDAFYGDFSALTESTTWDADAGSVTTLPGVTVANFECFQLAIGSGNDVVRSTLSGASQYVDSGAGNDTVTLGAGRDTVIGGDGNDVISTGAGHDSVEGGAGDDAIDLGTGGGWVDGGAGVDRLSLDLSSTGYDLRYYFGDGNGIGDFGPAYTAGASFDQLRSALAGIDAFVITNAYISDPWVQFRSVEKVDIVAGSGNDLVIYRGGSYYDGGAGGSDTFYANWSAATAAITWANDPALTQSVNDVSVSGLERLLLQTGSGADALSNLNVATDDVILTGAGNDSIHAGDGNDRIEAGSGNDFINAGSGYNTIDGGSGIDTASFATASAAVIATLLTATASNGSLNDTLTDIENLTGSTFNDDLTGDAGANVLDGGTGADTLSGGDGNDTYVVDASADTLVEANASLAVGGRDLVLSYALSYTLAANVEDARIMAAGAANVAGNALDNVLYSGSGNNYLGGQAGTDTASYLYAASAVAVSLALSGAQATGGSGSDTLSGIENLTGSDFADTLSGNSGANVLDGGLGADVMNGGDGNDTYVVAQAGDLVVETNAAPGGGRDLVLLQLASYTLTANVEDVRLMLGGAANVAGNALDNTLYAGAGNNYLGGGAGTDTVSYRYAASGVTVSLAIAVAQATGGSGTDILSSIENLGGSGFADTLSGNSGANVLDGGAGADTMSGGDGSDTYFVDSFGDVVVETNAALATGGRDLVQSQLASTTLGANVEDGRILSSGSANLAGNALDNILYAGSGNNYLGGGIGNDTVSYLHATAAVTVSLAITTSQVTVGSGSDTLVGIENLTGSAFADTLTGNSGANVLDGGAGVDTMSGGNGNDTYTVDNAGDLVVETNAALATGGRDLVLTQLASTTLGANIEDGRILSTGSANLAGNALDNTLYAGAGNNYLGGGGGTDTASYGYATAAVTVSLAAVGAQATGGSGTDTLVGIENLSGSSHADSLTGNAAANVLDGGAGADTMTGGDGSDTYFVDSLADVVIETNGVLATGGRDLVQSLLASTTLGANIEDGRILSGGNANLAGNALDNTLYAGAGNNYLGGGAGSDTASYRYATAAVTVSLAVAGAQATGGSGSDTLSGIENLTGSGFGDTLGGNTAANVMAGGAGSDTLTGAVGADTFVLDSALGSDTISDFASGVDKIRIGQSAIRVGDGDTAVEGASVVAGPGGFDATAELVIVTADIVGELTSAAAAAAIGSATAAYATGQRVLFAVDNGVSSALFLFTSAGADAAVGASELALLASLQATSNTALSDYVFGG